jgi:Ca2+/Na+ antiporter
MLKDNFNKFCLAVIALLLLLSLFFTIRASAEEYEQPSEQTETTTDETTDETHEVVQVSGVQVNDPTLYEKLDKMQESIDALTAAVAPSDGSNGADDEVPAQDPAPDYTAQISGISNQLEILTQQATAETAEPSAFEKPFEDYSTSEALNLATAVFVLLLFFLFVVKGYIF